MRKLEWKEYPKNRPELLKLATGISEKIAGGSPPLSHFIDLDESALNAYVQELREEHYHQLADRIAEEPEKVMEFVWKMGFMAGAIYSELDDHVWRDDK